MSSTRASAGAPAFLSEGGAAGAVARSVDWSNTPLGAAASWPQSLRTIVSVILHSRHPMFLWWGPELVQFYNDAYLPSFGMGKHPVAMGQRGRDCWREVWPIIGPQIDDVMNLGHSTWNEDHLVPIFRNDRLEEVYWTYGYSPVFDESGRVGGTLVACTETTSRVIGDRRSRTLRSLSEKTAWLTDEALVIPHAAEVLREATSDLAFGLFYRRDPLAGRPRLVESFGFADVATRDAADVAVRPHLPPFDANPRDSPRLTASLGIPGLPGGAWPEPSPGVVVTPLIKASLGRADDFLVFGLSPRLAFDDGYRNYVDQVADHIRLASARIDAFRARAATEAERNNLLLQAPVATALLTGPRHVFQLANDLFCQIVGQRDLVGRSYLDVFPQLVETPLTAVLDRVYQAGQPFATNEYLIPLDRRGDGIVEDCFFKFNLEPLRDASGAVLGMMAVAVDISEQVRGRLVLEKANAERQKLLEQLESASRAKDEFLAMLGHELRNPLSPIVTALRLMKLKGSPTTTREREVIERQVQHLTRLVDDLLDVSKITRGKVELRNETVEIAGVTSKAIEIASVLLEQHAHKLSVEVPRAGLLWCGDPMRLAQVVANLLTNAARYTPPGGDIRLQARRQGDTIVISVADNGIGIAPDVLPRIFDLFVQGKRTGDRLEGGLGIGLTLVKTLVTLHGGTVVARSEGPGKGSAFVITLPAAIDAMIPTVASRAAPPAQMSAAFRRNRVLVVDDNDDAARLLAEALRSAGHEVAVANDPVVALLLAEQFRPEIAVLDIGLPVMDGYELGARLRALPGLARCRLIALTGYGREHDRNLSLNAGFHAHLVKPVDLEKLLSTVAEAVAEDATPSGQEAPDSR